MDKITEKKAYVFGGNVYDTYEEARDAVRKAEEAEIAAFDPNPEVMALERQFDIRMNGTAKQRERDSNRKVGHSAELPLLLVITDKYDSSFYLLQTEEDFYSIALMVLFQRVIDGFWYDGEDEKLAKYILSLKSGKAAFVFLLGRCGDYEGFRIEKFQKVSP